MDPGRGPGLLANGGSNSRGRAMLPFRNQLDLDGHYNLLDHDHDH